MSKAQNNILVTGGAGYIGGHVVKALKLAGFHPVSVDYNPVAREYIEAFGPVVEADIRDTDGLIDIIKEYDIGAVVHMAASISVPESEEKPELYYDNNVGGTLSVLNAMLATGVKDIVFSSTAAVYGMPDSPNIDENTLPAPLNAYGATKLVCEQMLADIARAHGINAMIFRYFNAVGCDRDGDVGVMQDEPSNLLPVVLQAASGKRDGVEIFGTDYDTPDGTALRDYIHVSDLADAHVKGLKRLQGGKGGDILNLGSGANHSVQQVVDLAREVTGVDFEVRYAPRRAGDSAAVMACPKKAKAVLGWEASFTLKDMIQTAWNWETRG